MANATTSWHVPAGSVFRLSTPQGPQVGDLNVWHAANPRERFWASRTRQLHASHVSTGDRLWSVLPYMRPLCGIVADTLGREGRGVWGVKGGEEKGRSRWGGRCHDLLGTRCDPYGEFFFFVVVSRGGRGKEKVLMQRT